MKLSRIEITNYRRIRHADITFAGATFLIGQNNYGKSSVLKAVQLLLSMEAPEEKDFHVNGSDERATELMITGYFSGVDAETAQSRGFKGRVRDGQFVYRKTYLLTSPKKPTIECLEFPYQLPEHFRSAKTVSDLLNGGLTQDVVDERLSSTAAKLKAGWERDFLDLLAEFDMDGDPTWAVNPGGIPQNVLSRLPRVLRVSPLTKEGDVGEKGILGEALGILFSDLLAGTDLAESIEGNLKELQAQMSPDSDGSLIRKLRDEVNEIIAGVFPGCGIDVQPSLQDLQSVLKPSYEITLRSNTSTDASRQGTGLLRTAVFSMLRYHSQLKREKELDVQSLIVAFEEPELYLHPSAANLLRETIYALGQSDQIVCTTHSPWMIDLTQDLQSLTKMVQVDDSSVRAINYEVSEKLVELHEDDKARVKMLQMFDDELSRVFFCDRVVIVEGDTEQVVLRGTFRHLPPDLRKKALSTTQVVKARGKAAIISLSKYLRALSISPFVIHDRDRGTAGAEVFNAPILEAVGDPTRVCLLEECIEDELGYAVPSADKPYHAFRHVARWTGFDQIPQRWREIVSRAYGLEVPPSAIVIPPQAISALTGSETEIGKPNS